MSLTAHQREYHRTYQRARRAAIKAGTHYIKPRAPRRRPTLRLRRLIFEPLPEREQRDGHCLFCGHQSSTIVCSWCRAELERAR